MNHNKETATMYYRSSRYPYRRRPGIQHELFASLFFCSLVVLIVTAGLAPALGLAAFKVAIRVESIVIGSLLALWIAASWAQMRG